MDPYTLLKSTILKHYQKHYFWCTVDLTNRSSIPWTNRMDCNHSTSPAHHPLKMAPARDYAPGCCLRPRLDSLTSGIDFEYTASNRLRRCAEPHPDDLFAPRDHAHKVGQHGSRRFSGSETSAAPVTSLTDDQVTASVRCEVEERALGMMCVFILFRALAVTPGDHAGLIFRAWGCAHDSILPRSN